MTYELLASAVLAQHGGHANGGTGDLAMTIMLVTVLVAIWIILGVVCWIFWRAKKREDEARREADVRWQNARSS